ncbi:receptor-type tyrosine-protein phosphatase epsilon-like [Physella acuta]|uniref:receptor-type tyrosine-protein phosphatase epsilon-like n=1 Tax=Physella acuta TaxID=109671 RepID=UPI0027DAF8AC|nr:receptor-type tyrosine-protein phosphatase epsilon-like [Physella acuta]
MCAGLKAAYVFLSSYFIFLALGCDQGWFGSNCQFKCHCKQRNMCSDQGQCSNGGKCDDEWFGPSCQYYDLARSRDLNTAKTTDIQTVTDGDDLTCQPVVSNMTFTWTNSYLITWIRIITSNSDHVMNVSVTLNGSTSAVCRRFVNRMSDRYLSYDLHCDVSYTVNSVTVHGFFNTSVCSVHISGGRNVALKQVVNQSTTLEHKGSDYTVTYNESRASNAVDGKTSSNFADKSCTHTKPDKKKTPEWNLTLSRTHSVNRYVIYNRNENKERLKNFLLKSYDNTMRLVFNYSDGNSRNIDVYTITQPSHEAKYISIAATYKDKDGDMILTLCEVEIFGDVKCESGRFGLECNSTCNCRTVGEPCVVSTGACPAGCALGFHGVGCYEACPSTMWGYDCASTCNTNCLNKSCDSQTGHCMYGCIDGYTGFTCTEDVTDLPVPLIVFLVGLILALIFSIYFLQRRNQRIKKCCIDSLAFWQSYIHLKNRSSDTENSGQNETLIPKGKMNVFMQTHPHSYFNEQFQRIPRQTSDATIVGLLETNRYKNRYKDIVTYDHSRVFLEVNESKQEADYINASYVKGYRDNEVFIASQGPTSATVKDFVRMLWEHKIDKVVMLTKLVEDGVVKCEQYWPDGVTIEFDDIQLLLRGSREFADFTIRGIEIRKGEGPAHHFRRFHFTMWPDKGVPLTPWALADFEQRVSAEPTNKPVVVHCSAGVGRTGTFIALSIVMKQALDTGSMNLYETVVKLRQDRMLMVQTAEQYEFLHRVVQVSLVTAAKTIHKADLKTHLKTWLTKRFLRNSDIEQEFSTVTCVCDDIASSFEGKFETENDENVYQNSVRNERFTHIKPDPYYTPFLRNSSNETTYTNGLILPNFTKKGSHIITELPVPTAVQEFWRLVDQYNVALIVAFQFDALMGDETFGNYLPPRNEQAMVQGQLEIVSADTESDELWEIQTLQISNKNLNHLPNIVQESKRVVHLKCGFTDLDPEKWLKLMRTIKSLEKRTDNRVLFICSNGAEYSGMAYVLSYMIDQLDNGYLNIPYTVGTVKCLRPLVVPTLQQYKFLHQVIQLYNERLEKEDSSQLTCKNDEHLYTNSAFLYQKQFK